MIEKLKNTAFLLSLLFILGIVGAVETGAELNKLLYCLPAFAIMWITTKEGKAHE